MFRNLRLYKFSGDWPASEQLLSDTLAHDEFKPCGSLAERSLGWEPPAQQVADSFARTIAGADLIRLRHQARVLPAAAVREALEERLAEFETRTGQPANGKEKRDLKEEVIGKLLPQALTKSDRINGFFLRKEKLLGIDTASDKSAERFLDQLRAALDSLQVVPLSFSRPTGELLTQIFLGNAPTGFHAGRECRMQDPGTVGAYVNWMQFDLADSTVRKHVRDGLAVERLAIEYNAVLSCVLDADNVLRKIKLLGMDDMDTSSDEGAELSALARTDATFALLVGAVRELVSGLQKALAS